MKSRVVSKRFLGVAPVVCLVAVGGVAEARQFVDVEAGFKMSVPYTYRAFTKTLPRGERFWEFESMTVEGGERIAGNERAVVRVARTAERDPLKLLLAYERGGMKDRMPTYKVVAAPKLEVSKGRGRVAVASYEGLRSLEGALQFRFLFRVTVEIVKGRAFFKIVEVRLAGLPNESVTKRVGEVQAILNTLVVQ